MKKILNFFTNIFTYRNIVTLFGFITVWSILLLVWQIHITSDTGNRYQIYKTDDNTILLDKRTGLAWRNIWNNNKDRIPCNWEVMNFETSFNAAPIGEQKLRQADLELAFQELEQKNKKDNSK